jgi:DNA-binding transcriptional MerR regulator/methylmalonyl-CoA mutase cobalamin-binding subunit
MSSGLNIAALARRTGVAPDTLRKWEVRYSILKPSRTPGGQRRYSEREVARVLWLKARMEEGYRVGEAAALLGPIDAVEGAPAQQLEAILAAVARSDQARTGLLLDQVFALNPLECALADVIRPLLLRVGEAWREGVLSVAQEHLLSEALRARLGQFVGDPTGGIRGIAVLACAPGERHELGLMIAAVGLRNDGWQVVYLGADTPLPDAFALCHQLGARLLGISLVVSESAHALERQLGDGAGNATPVVIGGPAASHDLARGLGVRYAEPEMTRALATLRDFST